MSKFFIERPVFAWVIAILIMLGGGLAIKILPISQYPDVAPPAIQISITYPGASADTVQNTVVQVIEQQLNGLDNLRYIESESNSTGSASITVTFEQGTDPDIAQVQVQNKVSLAEPSLPSEVTAQGIPVRKYQTNIMLVVSLVADGDKYTDADLGNLMVSKLQDPIVRAKGVGEFMVMGAEYAMRIWIDPAKLFQYQLIPSDISSAITQQNTQVSSGQIGGLPTLESAKTNASIVGRTRLSSVEQFENILLKVNTDGSQIRLKDVAKVALGPEDYSISAKFNGKPSAGIALRLATGANLLETIQNVKTTVKNLESILPENVQIELPYDTSPVVGASISGVVDTLLEAIILVSLVMYLFLQNIRATLIVILVVPVVLLGTFGVLSIANYSINILTMFGMVLAIGLLVDDAIVVVENVERLMHEEGLGPKEATLKSMQEVQGALFGIAIVLVAVLLPMAFFAGSTGVIYRQFSITIVTAMTLSVFIALVFTPALCATFLKRPEPNQGHKKGFFAWFNRSFERGTLHYTNSVARIISKRSLFLLVYLCLILAIGYLFQRLPTTFLPDEDQGTLIVQVSLPQNATAERTQLVLDEITHYLINQEPKAVNSAFAVNGFSFAGRGQNSALVFVKLKDWSVRTANESVNAVAARMMQKFADYKEAKVFALVPPAIMELGNATGFDFFIQDTKNAGHAELMNVRNEFLYLASQDKRLMAVRPNGKEDEPQYKLVIDDEKARSLGLTIDDINATLSAAWGSSYINQFIYQDRIKKVYLQGKASSRFTPEDFSQWYFRNSHSEMVPFSAFGHGYWIYGSPRYERFNGIAAVQIMGSPAAGYSSGDAVAAVNDIMAKFSERGFKAEWHGLSYEENSAGSQTLMLYSISLIIVFLCLAALYESWSVPLAVILVVPFGVFGAIAAMLIRNIPNDVFFQVGLLTTVGLSAKNAILIVEFAKELYEKGQKSIVSAAVEAAKLRIRPIIMTSMAFILGVIPLTISSGAGAGSQHSIGTSVVGGVLTATFLAIFFVPLFYVLVVSLFSYRKRKNLSLDQF